MEADVVDRTAPWRHDTGKLAEQIVRFYHSQKRIANEQK
jgi:hypothetical protein